MNRKEVIEQIEQDKLIAVVRLDDPADLDSTVDSLLKGGVRIIEATMTIPKLLDYVPSLVNRVGGDMVFGIGSVLNEDMARSVIESGASFVVSPIMRKGIIEVAQDYNTAVSVGAYTPTEIQTAWEAGSDFVKVFPADTLGPSYIKGVRAPMPHLKLLPTGGVNVDNVDQWLDAGATALGVGSALVNTKAVRNGRFDVVRENARAFSNAVNKYIGG
ncbi:bifunctional 4-hydroxy-2-oxoglutarate aldolase/2-dehydro-3-deoxy-phosphogluconate aldolase [Natronogracilivirga saccharolytica]|uniref:Bifunctional 4-hydroxy-2-oxoglutarate aldolase/2-dehydro-3-deoxy-phosphogluconate aldolase n=1 Tax=Natronogracilivirga saccharolytica TaxID=2812953 RepID=A0A8J7S8F7_9BACT|nr:bifunctional 4-hydroxy-2-oxoglutarate aldolase/2-dehydro-3-deoxy-phosphogluconate aldolase [Natronogracilivirga saccharolytica]MBP3193888.1 bifunctional 4-hydroxy-2-oxoglutarate aldolase/2-dehydro-3-deoxy-phosphogluconate aldolase [Natronogracilivirga saccharolytica]